MVSSLEQGGKSEGGSGRGEWAVETAPTSCRHQDAVAVPTSFSLPSQVGTLPLPTSQMKQCPHAGPLEENIHRPERRRGRVLRRVDAGRRRAPVSTPEQREHRLWLSRGRPADHAGGDSAGQTPRAGRRGASRLSRPAGLRAAHPGRHARTGLRRRAVPDFRAGRDVPRSRGAALARQGTRSAVHPRLDARADRRRHRAGHPATRALPCRWWCCPPRCSNRKPAEWACRWCWKPSPSAPT